MLKNGTILLGRADQGQGPVDYLDLGYANRHGLVAGATGTGKTVTLRVLAEGFSDAGVPVFAADIKGDLSGLCQKGDAEDFLIKRADDIGFEDFDSSAYPTVFWDLFGRKGHPIRATVSDMGPLLLANLLNLTEAQEGVLNIAFDLADEEGLLLLDFKDLRAILNHVGEQAAELRTTYGNISKASVGAIQRRLLVLENQGGEAFFGEPALKLEDLMHVDRQGRGQINLLAAEELMRSPKLYATFLLWLLSELFEQLPEVGDPEKPKLVFFFDEAHLLFSQAPKALLTTVAQVVRLIRSKGVGVYFVTQSPGDIPDEVLAQLGNRIQHALRAYTPRERKSLKAAAQSFRENPAFDTATVIGELGVGEALISTLEAKGIPSVVNRSLIRPPSSRLTPLSDKERNEALAVSPLKGLYDETLDRESAFEILAAKAEQAAAAKLDKERAEAARKRKAKSTRGIPKTTRRRSTQPRSTGKRAGRSRGDTVLQTAAKSVLKTVGRQLGRALVRGILGSLAR
ncbi:MAG: helicase HerA-like domain-containing protein [Magnetovibrionaceae bacterium]